MKVKDKLYKKLRPSTINKYITIVIWINNTQFSYYTEKKSNNRQYYNNDYYNDKYK